MPTKNNSQNKPQSTNDKIFLKKIVPTCFAIIFSIILIVLLCFSWIPYCAGKTFSLPNIVSLIMSLPTAAIIYWLFKKLSVTDRAFYITITIIFSILFILQIVMLYHTYFYSGWDMRNLDILANTVAKTGSIMNAENSGYLSMYPNNVLLVAILSLIKSVPFFGEHYIFLLSINAMLVNLACLLTCLSIKKLLSNRAALLAIFVLAPLLIFSPWIIIPYSDTFTILLPVFIFYIYLKNNKRWWDYFLISLCGTIGFFIKPTIIIVVAAIVFTKLFTKKWNKRPFYCKSEIKHIAIFSAGIIAAFLCKTAATSYIDFHQNDSMAPVSFVHYLAMGQNDENCGIYLAQDVEEAKYGKLFELKKFLHRISSRNPIETINFFTRKLLVNYNDGTFAWSAEGSFYYDVPIRECHISNSLTNYFYESKNYYPIFVQINQTIWIFTLFGCIFVIRRTQSKEISVLEISLIGLSIFVMLFEARARYLFSYIPFFIVTASLGYQQLKDALKNRKISINQR